MSIQEGEVGKEERETGPRCGHKKGCKKASINLKTRLKQGLHINCGNKAKEQSKLKLTIERRGQGNRL